MLNSEIHKYSVKDPEYPLQNVRVPKDVIEAGLTAKDVLEESSTVIDSESDMILLPTTRAYNVSLTLVRNKATTPSRRNQLEHLQAPSLECQTLLLAHPRAAQLVQTPGFFALLHTTSQHTSTAISPTPSHPVLAPTTHPNPPSTP
eukprot:g56117.t1